MVFHLPVKSRIWSRLCLISFCICFLFSTNVFAEYSVVMRDSGKIVKGELVQETDQTIVLKVDNVNLQFKKNLLDLEKMKTLNESQPAQKPTDGKTFSVGNAPPAQKKPEVPVADLARKVSQDRKGNATPLTEGDRPQSTLSPEKIAQLVRTCKSRIEETEAQIKSLKEKGASAAMIGEKEKELEDLQKKLKFLTHEKPN